MTIQHRLTSKSQVTIPKDVRTALGVEPGDLVRFDKDEEGRFVIAKGDEPQTESIEQRRTRIRAALDAMTGIINIGMSTDEFMRELRGDWEP